MYNSTGVAIDQCHALFEKLNNHSEKNAIPPILGLLEALVVTLKYLRRNHVQAELAESHGDGPLSKPSPTSKHGGSSAPYTAAHTRHSKPPSKPYSGSFLASSE